jgi:hypothetical protein
MDASDGGDPVWDDIEKNWIWTYEDDEVDRAFAEFDEREILSPLTIDELVVARANFAQWKPPASLSVYGLLKRCRSATFDPMHKAGGRSGTFDWSCTQAVRRVLLPLPRPVPHADRSRRVIA